MTDAGKHRLSLKKDGGLPPDGPALQQSAFQRRPVLPTMQPDLEVGGVTDNNYLDEPMSPVVVAAYERIERRDRHISAVLAIARKQDGQLWADVVTLLEEHEFAR